MDNETLEEIKKQCERVETETGFGKVIITFEHGRARFIHPSPAIMLVYPLGKSEGCIKPANPRIV